MLPEDAEASADNTASVGPANRGIFFDVTPCNNETITVTSTLI